MVKIEQEILDRLARIESKLEAQNDEYMNLEETANYLDLSPAYLYKLTSRNQIPVYKPSGKKLFFKRSELNTWISSKRIASENEIKHNGAKKYYSNS